MQGLLLFDDTVLLLLVSLVSVIDRRPRDFGCCSMENLREEDGDGDGDKDGERWVFSLTLAEEEGEKDDFIGRGDALEVKFATEEEANADEYE